MEGKKKKERGEGTQMSLNAIFTRPTCTCMCIMNLYSF
jgi:hypothetical protein